MKQAILLVSFGTTHLEQLEKSIENGVKIIATCFETINVRLAFSSKVIINKLKTTANKHILFVEEAMDEFKEEGYEGVLIQPLHLIDGKEYNKVLEIADAYRSSMNIQVGKPLLTDEQTCIEVLKALVQPYERSEEMLLLLGHGTSHQANSLYQRLQEQLQHAYSYGVVSTLEKLDDIDEIVHKMQQNNKTKITIIPLMLVAGKHIEVDVKGSTKETWEGRFRSHGIEVQIVEKGLGEYPFVYEIFKNHLIQLKEIS